MKKLIKTTLSIILVLTLLMGTSVALAASEKQHYDYS